MMNNNNTIIRNNNNANLNNTANCKFGYILIILFSCHVMYAVLR